MLLQEQSEIGVAQAVDAATHINPSCGAPDRSEVASVVFMPRDLFIRATIEDDCLLPFPIAVEVDDLVDFTVSLGSDDIVAVHPSDGSQCCGIVEQNVIIVCRGEEVVCLP